MLIETIINYLASRFTYIMYLVYISFTCNYLIYFNKFRFSFLNYLCEFFNLDLISGYDWLELLLDDLIFLRTEFQETLYDFIDNIFNFFNDENFEFEYSYYDDYYMDFTDKLLWDYDYFINLTYEEYYFYTIYLLEIDDDFSYINFFKIIYETNIISDKNIILNFFSKIRWYTSNNFFFKNVADLFFQKKIFFKFFPKKNKFKFFFKKK